MFELAERNNVTLPYKSVEDIRNAYEFNNLQEFLDIYYQGMSVLLTRQDFHDLTYAYLKRVHADKCRHVEIFFDPQGHTERGVAFEDAIEGILSGLEQGEKDFDISYNLILSFLRHLSEEDAFETLAQATPYLERILGVGLDSSELGHPPSKFERVYTKAREMGLICPLSNLKLCVVDDLKNHPLKTMLNKGLKVTMNSDDPSYFGGYLNDNYLKTAEALDLNQEDIFTLVKNGFDGAYLSETRKDTLMKEFEIAKEAYLKQV